MSNQEDNMMKRFFYILSLGLVLTALSQSCAKEAEVSSDLVPEAGNKLITITVGAPEDLQTRVSFSTDPSDEDMLSVRWQANDKIVINGNTFTIDTMNEEGTLATFIGENPGAGPYTIFYAGNGAEAKTLAEVESQDYSSQTQSANGVGRYLCFPRRRRVD